MSNKLFLQLYTRLNLPNLLYSKKNNMTSLSYSQFLISDIFLKNKQINRKKNNLNLCQLKGFK